MALDNTNIFMIIIGSLIVLLGAGLLIYGLITWLVAKKRHATRVETFVSREVLLTDDVPDRLIVPREIQGSFFSRTISSGVKKIVNLLGRLTPGKMAVEAEQKLTIAGNPANMQAGEFFTVRFFVLMLGFILAGFILGDFQTLTPISLLLGLMIIVVCYALPDVWLNGRMRNRQDEIRRELPDALDMLSVCAMAGLGFDQSLQKISQYWDTTLGQEINRTTQEMEMGLTRAEALKHLGNRLQVDDLSRFVAIMIQADKVGMSYADVLHSQAEQLRVLRQYRAREIANRLPGKMILPVALFIFPAIMAVILGPALPALLGMFR